MAKDVFSVPIFFIIFREMIEASIIVSVLLSFVEQLMSTGRLSPREDANALFNGDDEAHNARVRKIIKRMRIQIWAGTLTGFFIALCLGAAFIAVFYTKLNNLWAKTEQIWEGVFCIIAAILIYIMGIAFLKMDRSRIKWRYKLAAAFERGARDMTSGDAEGLNHHDKAESVSSKWALFLLPCITLLREGLEAIVFVGGVSMGLPAYSIPLPVVIGLIAGCIVGYVIYRTGSSTTLHWFLIVSTTFLFLIGAGLFSKGIGFLQYYKFASAVGGDVAESGDGPGSYDVHGNVWHLTYGNPETGAPTTNGGWQIFNAIFGWNNTATLGTILGYVFYWIAVIATLVWMKWKEGRFTFFGKASAAHKRRAAWRQDRAAKRGVPVEHSASDVDSASADGSNSNEKRAPAAL